MTHDAVQDAIAHFNLEIADIQPVPDSFSSIVRLIELVSGEQLVLKIPYVKRKLFRELGALEAFHDDLPVPDVIDVWVPDDDRPGALLLSRLPGANIVDPVTIDLARQMGGLLGKLHTHRLDHYGDREEAGDPLAHDWWAMCHAVLDRWKPHCVQAVPPDLYARSLALYRDLAADLPAPDGPCWVHNDYRPGNILVEDGKITGLIDFESARGGSADRD
ncbi:MAG: aminoglycoside phosphotransferase family protein, partial [Anaerolineae bacterium]|nr:aminoglycoside phosphotransferase family protein [Anaerolineae bacterium]